ncbi:MAG: (2Fe-2S)-binding protein, partial [Alphaproteobacteria bacterium]
MTKTAQIAVTVNGEKYVEDVPVRMNLADFLRTKLGLTGTHVGC